MYVSLSERDQQNENSTFAYFLRHFFVIVNNKLRSPDNEK